MPKDKRAAKNLDSFHLNKTRELSSLMQWGMRISSRSSGDLAAHDGIEANTGDDN